MIERTTHSDTRVRLVRSLVVFLPVAAVCLTLLSADTPPDLRGISERPVLQTAGLDDTGQTLECLLRRLPGLACDGDEPVDQPPPPTGPVSPVTTI